MLARFTWIRPHINSAGAALEFIAFAILILIALTAIFAPLIATQDPQTVDPLARLKPPGNGHLLGTDAVGRDLFSRIVYGSRVSLALGLACAALCVVAGMILGLLCGYIRVFDLIMMRIVDGLMAIPSILLAVAIVALAGSGFVTVMIAITIPEIPRVIRLVRSVVLSARSEPFIEAARTLGTPTALILRRHLMPQTFAPLTVQASYVLAAAILTESVLSFLGCGISPEIPTWGNIMADGRNYFRIMPSLVLLPGLVLSLTVLSINLIGNSLRDRLDPRLTKGRI